MDVFTLSPATSDALRYGAAATWLTTGTHSAPDSEQWIVVGAPGQDFIEGPFGAFYLHAVDVNDGSVAPFSAADTYVSPDSTRQVLFGGAVLAADVVACYQDAGNPAIWHACGEELLVSAAPSLTKIHPGTVFVYERDGDPAANSVLRHAYTVERPSPAGGPVNGDGFGRVMAAPRRLLDPARPWVRTGDHPVWVMFLDNGAPSSGVTTWFIPLEVQISTTLVGAPATPFPRHTASSRGGDTDPVDVVAAGDWNGDGRFDFATGRPDIVNGRVDVYWGFNTPTSVNWDVSSTEFFPEFSNPLYLEALTMHDSTRGTDPWRFGESLATGWVHFDPATETLAEALVVGAPFFGETLVTGPATVTPGAVCDFRWTGVGGTLADAPESAAFGNESVWDRSCHVNPENTDGDSDDGHGEEYGATVVTGNFMAADVFHASSMQARQHEIAVTAAGFDGDDGKVLVHRTEPSGTSSPNGGGMQPGVWKTLLSTASGGARYGSVLAAGGGERFLGHEFATTGTPAVSEWSDLVIGVPADSASVGMAGVTEARSVSNCVDAHGYWGVRDGYGDIEPHIVTCTRDGGNWMVVRFVRDLPFTVSDSSGVCETTDTDGELGSALLSGVVPAGTILEIPWAWSCGTATFAASEYVDSENLLANLHLRYDTDASPDDAKTVSGQDLSLYIGFVRNGSGIADDELVIELSIAGFDHTKFDIDPDCDVDTIPTFERVDAVCED